MLHVINANGTLGLHWAVRYCQNNHLWMLLTSALPVHVSVTSAMEIETLVFADLPDTIKFLPVVPAPAISLQTQNCWLPISLNALLLHHILSSNRRLKLCTLVSSLDFPVIFSALYKYHGNIMPSLHFVSSINRHYLSYLLVCFYWSQTGIYNVSVHVHLTPLIRSLLVQIAPIVKPLF